MSDRPEEKARQAIDELLAAAGWVVQSRGEANTTAGRAVAIREFPLKAGYGFADYLLERRARQHPARTHPGRTPGQNASHKRYQEGRPTKPAKAAAAAEG